MTNLPAAQAGLDVTGFKNLSQSYLFSSSAGSVSVTNVQPANSNAGNDQAFTNAVWTPAAPILISGETFSTAAGGTITFTSAAAHGLAVGNHITSRGNTPRGYNFADKTVATVADTTHFTVTGVGSVFTISNAVWSAPNGGTRHVHHFGAARLCGGRPRRERWQHARRLQLRRQGDRLGTQLDELHGDRRDGEPRCDHGQGFEYAGQHRDQGRRVEDNGYLGDDVLLRG